MAVPEQADELATGRAAGSGQAPGLGPGSLLWRYAGDWRSVIEGGAAGVLQLMYPPLGTAVAAQSEFFADPFARIFRSVPQIWATIFASDAENRGRQVRNLHNNIKGVTPGGDRFHALDPETFWWAHATFTWLIFRSIERYHPPGELDAAGRERLYAETVAWYARYGVSMRPVPADYTAFQNTFEQFCAERLELTPPARRSLDIAVIREPDALPFLAPVLFRATGPLLRPWGRAVTVGNLPHVVRERFDLPWSTADQRRLDASAAALRHLFQATPAAVNRSTFFWATRYVGARTRPQRYQPTA